VLVILAAIFAWLVMLVGKGPRWISFLLAGGALVAPVLLSSYGGHFSGSGAWTYLSGLSLVTYTLLTVREPRLLSTVASVLGLGYAAALSWGVPTPGLLSGSFLAMTLALLWQDGTSGIDRVELPKTFTMTLVMTVLLAAVFVARMRGRYVYREPPLSELSASVAEPAFALVRMSPQSAAYLENVRACVKKFPASRTAVLPDGPGLYPLLRLRNPFHSDWWSLPERNADHDKRVAEVVSRLNREGDWLVLFQSYDLADLSGLALDRVDAPGPPFAHAPEDLRLLTDLVGVEVHCGSLTGKYQAVPRPPASTP
jgi:hypothetical protein